MVVDFAEAPFLVKIVMLVLSIGMGEDGIGRLWLLVWEIVYGLRWGILTMMSEILNK